MQSQSPVLILNQNAKREHGRKAQVQNIEAARVVSSLICSTLGPQAMLKMILDPMGGTVLTNDGNCILREIDVVHPAAKHMLELARAQDEEIGDGTTSVIVLAGEILSVSRPLLDRQIHPLKIVKGFSEALTICLEAIEEVSTTVDIDNREELENIVKACLGTKFNSYQEELMCNLAINAALRVMRKDPITGNIEIDVKRYAKVEKIPGGSVEDSEILDGVMFNKDHIHSKMRRRIDNPRIILLDTPLEYTKGETTVNVEVTNETDFAKMLREEEQYVRSLCATLIKHKPDVVITEKGCSDLAAHFLAKAGITVIRRLRKTDNNRIARSTGATICSRVDEIIPDDIGTGAKLFEIKKIGDEYFTFITGCPKGTACSIILRGASKDTLNEMERNLQDAMSVARNIIKEPRAVLGAGAIEMHISRILTIKAKGISGIQQQALQAIAMALEVIPRTLAHNCGSNVIRVITDLRARHAKDDGIYWGVDGIQGVVTDVRELKVIEPAAVKIQALKTAIEAACMILRVDDVVSGTKVKQTQQPQQQQAEPAEE